MSDSTLKLVAAIILIFHGIGHYMGILASLGIKMTDRMSAHSPLLSGLLGDKGAKGICLVLFAPALVGFIAAGFALLGWLVPQALWFKLAVLSSVFSVLGLVFYWNALAFLFNKLGSILVNALVLIGLLLLRWPQGLFRE
jgi:hypothetical protein